MTCPKIGLVLGGGGSRGLAHVGVLQILQRENIPVDLLVGTSMGGIIAILHGLGYSGTDIVQQIQGLQGNSLSMKLMSPRARQRRVKKQLAELFGDKTFADLSLPVYLMAVDMLHGREVVLGEGALMTAALASSAVPGAFPPVKYGEMELADGGVIDSLATHAAFDHGADKVIAVDVYPALEKDNPWTDPLTAIMGFDLPTNIFSTSGNGPNRIPTIAASMWRSVRVITWHLHEERLKTSPPDVLLRPAVENYGSLDFKDIEGPLRAGVEVAERHLAELRGLVEQP